MPKCCCGLAIPQKHIDTDALYTADFGWFCYPLPNIGNNKKYHLKQFPNLDTFSNS